MTMTANVETMFYVRTTPWHGLGTRVEEALTSQDALHYSGLDWKVEQGVLTIQTAAKRLVNLYDASGRAVFSSVVDGAVRIPLSVGVYLLDGCKVLVH